MKTEQTYFKFMQEFMRTPVNPKIKASLQSKTTFRDGGSLGWQVENQDECGYCRVIQDFSVQSKRNGTEGTWFANRPAPDHVNWHPINFEDIEFV